MPFRLVYASDAGDRNMRACRRLCLLALVMLPGFWLVYEATVPGAFDPLGWRLELAGLVLGLYVLSYTSPRARRHMVAAARLLAWLIGLWFTAIVVLNDFHPAYAMGHMLVLPATGMTFGVGQTQSRPLALFLASYVVLIAEGALLVEAPLIDPVFFITSLAALALVVYIILSARMAVQQELMASKEQAEEAARFKTSLLTNVSHEVRTPLSGIIGFAQVLAEEGQGDQREFARLIEQNGRRLMDTLNSILVLARLESNRLDIDPSFVDPAVVVAEVVAEVAPAAAEKSVALHFHAPPARAQVLLDPAVFRAVALQMVSNAVKFTPRGTVDVYVTASSQGVALCVHDTGVGIDAAFLPHIFDAFRQESDGPARQHEGLGIGLAVTKRLVDLLGGRIDVESTKGTGTRFTVHLPAATPVAQPALPAPAVASA